MITTTSNTHTPNAMARWTSHRIWEELTKRRKRLGAFEGEERGDSVWIQSSLRCSINRCWRNSKENEDWLGVARDVDGFAFFFFCYNYVNLYAEMAPTPTRQNNRNGLY
ncbi:hypothetical protein OUZ56_028354 [Daphnia magna]|uniref:Uncharacterized protein n=1 Tax=Daphnia magna TaxID=35525 RepID=A0ABR0B3L7_9CRUS|nr:hypothetical protein OUZ56_028354 [Daphnia magna]